MFLKVSILNFKIRFPPNIAFISATIFLVLEGKGKTKHETYAIVLIVLATVIAAFLFLLYWLCGGGMKKKQSSTPNPVPMRSVTTPSAQRSYPADLERGEGSKTTGGTKDGGISCRFQGQKTCCLKINN